MKAIKRITSVTLSFALLFSCFAILGIFHSSAVDFPELTHTLSLNADTASGTLTYTAENPMTAAQWQGYSYGSRSDIVFDEAGIVVEPDYLVSDGQGSYVEPFSAYGIAGTGGNATAYPTGDNPYNIDWDMHTVNSVTYTLLPRPYIRDAAYRNQGTLIPIAKDIALYIYRNGTDGGSIAASINGSTDSVMTLFQYYDSIGATNVTQDGNVYSTEMTVKINYAKTGAVDQANQNAIYAVDNIQISFDTETPSTIGGATVKQDTWFRSTWEPKNSEGEKYTTSTPIFGIPTTTNTYATPDISYSYVYLKGAEINYTENPDTYIPEFVSAYAQVANVSVADIEAADADTLAAYQTDIETALAIYEGYNDTQKAYVGDTRYNHLLELNSAVYAVSVLPAVQLEIQQNGIYKSEFADATLTANQWRMDALGFDESGYNAAGAGTEEDPVYAFATAAPLGNYGYHRFGFAQNTTTAPQHVSLRANNNVATVHVASDYETNSVQYGTENYFSHVGSIQAVLDNAYLPSDIQKISGTISLDVGEYYFLYGDKAGVNYPMTAANDDSVKDARPTYGFCLSINADGKLSFRYACLSIDTANQLYKFSRQTMHTNAEALATLSTGALDMTRDTFDFTIEFITVTDTNSESANFGTTYYVPQLTLSDGVNTLKGALHRGLSMVTTSDTGAYATSITGFAVSRYVAASAYATYDSDRVAVSESGNPAVYGKYEDTYEISNIQVIGDAPQVLGASIKTGSDPDEQDIRFGVSFAENSYLISQGYSVAGYGAVVAFANGLPENTALTIDSVYDDAYANLGYVPVVKRIEATELPTETYVNIGDSAAGAENLGIPYQVRAFAVYEKDGEELIIYSQNDIAGKVADGETKRSIFSTGKIIAKAIQSNPAFEAQESYTVREQTITYAQIEDIISGTGTSQETVGDTNVKCGEALLAFTAAHYTLV